jgi:hypothetical protein
MESLAYLILQLFFRYVFAAGSNSYQAVQLVEHIEAKAY